MIASMLESKYLEVVWPEYSAGDPVLITRSASDSKVDEECGE